MFIVLAHSFVSWMMDRLIAQMVSAQQIVPVLTYVLHVMHSYRFITDYFHLSFLHCSVSETFSDRHSRAEILPKCSV